MTWTVDIGAIADNLNRDLDQVARAVKISLFNGVIRDTRVDTGRLRGNWQTTTGQPARGTIERLDPNATIATRDVEQTVQGDTVDYLTNNLPYAEVWEQEDGMVSRNVARIQRTVEEEVRRVRR